MFVIHDIIQDKIGAKWPYIIKISPRYTDLDESMFTWMNFNKELEWCRNNCKSEYVLKLIVHDNDYNILDSLIQHNGHKSAFFAFESHDEALVFGIKFKR